MSCVIPKYILGMESQQIRFQENRSRQIYTYQIISIKVPLHSSPLTTNDYHFMLKVLKEMKWDIIWKVHSDVCGMVRINDSGEAVIIWNNNKPWKKRESWVGDRYTRKRENIDTIESINPLMVDTYNIINWIQCLVWWSTHMCSIDEYYSQ